MEKKDGSNMKEGIATRVKLEKSGAMCDGSPKVCNSSPLVSPTATINMPQGLYNVDVASTFRVPLITVSDLHMLINCIKDGKHADCVFDGVNISIPHKVFKKAKHGLKRIMMNSKGFFFFKFDSRAGLEAILEGGPWLIRKSLIILKKWLMDTRFLKEELTRIPIWVKLHDVPTQFFKEDDISLIYTFIEANLVDVVTIAIPLLTEDGFTKETIWVSSPPIVTTSNVITPTVEKTNDGFQTVSKEKKKGKSTSTNGGQVAGLSVKQNVRYQLKTTGTSFKKNNISTSNSYSVLNDEEEEEEEDVVNVYDETANVSTKTGGSLPFTATIAKSLSEFELKNILFDKMDKIRSYMTRDKHQHLYDALLNSICLDDSIASGAVNLDKVQRKRDRGDDQDPTAGSDQGKKKRRKGKDFEPSKDKV
uniref:DUF4283 domain-containing protein n=1 Tax=Tanacetum cinerariifolium TaxID=118510 RepID=A0A6L2JVY0_TANCI|nr:hypothetical protein [Tanacetum cinerariifolium]